MPEVNALDHRDASIYRAWVAGTRRADLAEQYQVSRQAIDKAIGRIASGLPPVDKAAEVHRAIDLCESMLAVWVPDALAKDKGASREARGWASILLRVSGIDRRELHVSGQVEHDHTVEHEPAPSLAEVLEDWRQRGIIRPQAELTRLDGGG
jgi:hypothetical protein